MQVQSSDSYIRKPEGSTAVGSTVMNGDRVLTGEREAVLAGQAVAALRGEDGVLVIENSRGRTGALPPELGHILQHVLDVMSTGGTMTLSAIPEVVTTTTAAAMLNTSRPTLMGLIKDGKIPVHMVGSHHRLKSSDVLAYRDARRARERAAFEALRDLDDSEA